MQRTRPARCSTCRCLVTACRVIARPDVNSEMDRGPRSESRATNARRVGSPKAAKTGAGPWRLRLAGGMDRIRDVLFDSFYLHAPALLVSGEGFYTPVQWNFVETGFGQ